MWYRQAEQKRMIIMRGISGSGKSTKAKQLAIGGVVLGSDEFWGPDYDFDKTQIGEAHRWNQDRVRTALEEGASPVVVDNTNVSLYEFRPYVEMALEHGYDIEYAEPDTPWKFDAEELAKRNQHDTPPEVIQDMIDRWDSNFSTEDVLKSRAPWEVESEPA
jgi:predicted kinase